MATRALSANRFAMDWGAIEASLSLHHRYHSDSQWKDVERQPKARAIHTRAEKMTLSPGDDDLPTKALEIACSDSAVRILLCSKICIFVLAYFSGVFPAKSATIRACAFAFCCSSEIPQQFISLNKSWHVLDRAGIINPLKFTRPNQTVLLTKVKLQVIVALGGIVGTDTSIKTTGTSHALAAQFFTSNFILTIGAMFNTLSALCQEVGVVANLTNFGKE